MRVIRQTIYEGTQDQLDRTMAHSRGDGVYGSVDDKNLMARMTIRTIVDEREVIDLFPDVTAQALAGYCPYFEVQEDETPQKEGPQDLPDMPRTAC